MEANDLKKQKASPEELTNIQPLEMDSAPGLYI